jgi:hypothetical protein
MNIIILEGVWNADRKPLRIIDAQLTDLIQKSGSADKFGNCRIPITLPIRSIISTMAWSTLLVSMSTTNEPSILR